MPRPATGGTVPPILILSGQRDDRIPPSYVEECATMLRMRAPARSLVVRMIDDADHFAIFSRRQTVVSALGGWIASAASDRAPR